MASVNYIEKPESELKFENELISYLQHVGGSKQWEYLPNIKTTEQLWANFRQILQRNNQEQLHGMPLSDTEFAQVRNVIGSLRSPFEAGQWLYGVNGKTQVEIQRDDSHGNVPAVLTIFDQDHVGAGNTVYQIVNQIERPHVLPGKQNCRFDTTLLINGLPIIQIEEKTSSHDALEGLNQIRQYISWGVYGDIYSTVQILVGLTPTDAVYMANTDDKSFNTDFAFHWQHEKDSTPVYQWKEFCDLFLSIPQAHRMATNYMILDNNPDHKKLIVMRPYQVYATKRVLEKLKSHAFGTDPKEVGYVWHTTGSGKTISSFKTAWLASRLPNVDKVVFIVDRRALTRQTYNNYHAYDPDVQESGAGGVITDTANVNDLRRKVKSTQGAHNVIITSVQKMGELCGRKNFPQQNKKIMFIVDEAHRSTNGKLIPVIKDKFPFSAWVGYTGTPVFDGDLTHQVFGDCIHAYTIREAIADKNVLGFKVDFQHTLPDSEIREKVLPAVLQEKHPEWSEKQINDAIARMTNEEADDLVDSGVYDNNPRHIAKVVDDIVCNWRKRSADYRYHAILTTHVGNGSSIPMALAYYAEFQKANRRLVEEGKRPLKVAVTFSRITDNGAEQYEGNRGLSTAIEDYNRIFGTSFDDTTVDAYFNDVADRLAGRAEGEPLDLVIVVNQLLTGYDAPSVNTLYVDRLLAGATLIQAYSRTNRIENNHSKPFGNIVNYRYPQAAKSLMDKALKVYANRNSADTQNSLGDIDDTLVGVIMPEYDTYLDGTAATVREIADLTAGFTRNNPSEKEQEHLLHLISRFNDRVAALKQYDEFDTENPEKLYTSLGISKDHYEWVMGPLRRQVEVNVRAQAGERSTLDLASLDFEIEHISNETVNYDYINDLLADLINAVHEGKEDDTAIQSRFDKLRQQTDMLENRQQADQVMNTAQAAVDGTLDESVHPAYPVKPEDMTEVVNRHAQVSRRERIVAFRKKWGLIDVVSAQELISAILDRHTPGEDDLKQGSEVERLLDGALRQDGGKYIYQYDAEDPAVRALSRLKYRNQLREALRKFADEMTIHY